MAQFKLQKEFPLLEEFERIFDVTDRTIFAYDDCIYTNYQLPPDIIIHEETHLKQQKKYGLDNWISKYFIDLDFRLKMEVEAYRKQIESIKDRELRFRIRMDCIEFLSSSLYGNMCSKEEAKILLK